MVGTVFSSKYARHLRRGVAATLCMGLIVLGQVALLPGRAQQPAGSSTAAQKISNDQLDSLVAPIALYPDPLLAQVLAASTYPLEIVQLQQFLNKNPNLKEQALADAVMKQPWDPTVQALAALPDVVKRLADDIQWTTDLGNAFLAQESDVMAAVQRMRKKAQDKGALKSDDKMVVETQTAGNNSVIVIEQANPQVVYVPSYDPTYVYGSPIYPYPPIYYPPYAAGGLFLTFGIGLAIGAWGGWCCGAGWGGNNVSINNNNNFVRNSNRQNGNGNGQRGDRSNWQHNPQHRGGAPYGNRATADRFGGTARGDARPGASSGQSRPGQGGQSRPATRPSQGGPGQAGSGRREAVPGQGVPSGNPGGVSNRANSAIQGNPGGGRAADRVGGQNVSRTGGGGDALSGGPRGNYNGGNAGQAGNRGGSSMGGRGGGGGGARGGGGGGRGGGGGGRRR